MPPPVILADFLDLTRRLLGARSRCFGGQRRGLRANGAFACGLRDIAIRSAFSRCCSAAGISMARPVSSSGWVRPVRALIPAPLPASEPIDGRGRSAPISQATTNPIRRYGNRKPDRVSVALWRRCRVALPMAPRREATSVTDNSGNAVDPNFGVPVPAAERCSRYEFCQQNAVDASRTVRRSAIIKVVLLGGVSK